MRITYAIWQGSNLLSIGNTAKSMKEVDKLIAELNASDVAKSVKFSANISKIEAGNL